MLFFIFFFFWELGFGVKDCVQRWNQVVYCQGTKTIREKGFEGFVDAINVGSHWSHRGWNWWNLDLVFKEARPHWVGLHHQLNWNSIQRHSSGGKTSFKDAYLFKEIYNVICNTFKYLNRPQAHILGASMYSLLFCSYQPYCCILTIYFNCSFLFFVFWLL